ncbi:hypothetical protein SKAU_G00027600 [Synaphobranchus kaupii]|uniref:Uncharacterized protein n=1 Tax=Synaphobranchus kaupii TaxID=118154 RepID=A0A9Q1GDM5_SYNKA|nr:hypothetical protein SKAU_G00027600 [Synaphobranchus kaupii]
MLARNLNIHQGRTKMRLTARWKKMGYNSAGATEGPQRRFMNSTELPPRDGVALVPAPFFSTGRLDRDRDISNMRLLCPRALSACLPWTS